MCMLSMIHVQELYKASIYYHKRCMLFLISSSHQSRHCSHSQLSCNNQSKMNGKLYIFQQVEKNLSYQCNNQLDKVTDRFGQEGDCNQLNIEYSLNQKHRNIRYICYHIIYRCFLLIGSIHPHSQYNLLKALHSRVYMMNGMESIWGCQGLNRYSIGL